MGLDKLKAHIPILDISMDKLLHMLILHIEKGVAIIAAPMFRIPGVDRVLPTEGRMLLA